MSSLLCTRKVYQMTVISVILVGLITLIIVVSLPGSRPLLSLECQQIEITVDVQPEAILLTWATNPCAMIYIIRHYINGELNHSATFPHPFSTLWLQREDCSAHSIQISTEVFPGLDPFDDVYENFSILWDGDTAVQNLEFNPGTRHFEWQAPEVPDNCDLKYLVEFTSDHGDYDETVLVNDDFFASPIIDNIACSTSHINVTTWVGKAEAYGESRNTVRTEPMADNLEVRNIRFESAENTRFVWDPPDDTYFCNVEYEVHFTNDFDPIGGPVSTRDNFLDIAITPCSDNRITIVAVAHNGDQYRSEPITHHHRGPNPENLKARNIRFESTVISRFAWDPPEGSELCNITYIIHFTNEYYPVEGPREIDDNFYDIIVHPCSHNRISVITSAYNDGPYHSDPVDYSHRGPVPENLEVQILTFDSENTRFVWDPPENSQLCDIEYEVLFRNQLEPDGELVNTSDSFFDIVTIPCSDNRIDVTVFVNNDGHYQSDPVSYAYRGPTPQNLEVRYLRFESTDTTRFVWEPPENSELCNITYTVHFTNEDCPVAEPRDIDDNFYDIIVHPCSNNKISIITSAYNDGPYHSGPVEYAHIGSTPEDLEVQNLRFESESTRFAWDAPEDSQLCNIRYIIHFTNELIPGEDTIDTEYDFFDIEVHPCTNNIISVTTFVYNDGNYMSDPVIYAHTGPTPENLQVLNLRFKNVDNNPRFEWDPPENSQLCDIEYEVLFINQPETNGQLVNTSNSFFDIVMIPCSDNRINVTAFVNNDGHYQGDPVSYAYRGPIPQNLEVRHLRFEGTDTTRFVWEPPENAELCNITYTVHFINEDYPVAEPRDIDDNFYDIVVHPCSNNRISIITSAYNNGPYQSGPVEHTHIGPTPENLEVQNLTFEIENDRFVWEAPEDTQLCNIRYIIHFTNELIPDGDTVDTVYDFFDIEVYPCSNNTISVITSVYNDGDYESEPAKYSHTGPTPENLDVRNLRFEIENTRFAWEAPENSQHCNIRYTIHFTNELSPEGDTMETEDQFFNIELYPCSNNRISVITSVYNDGDYESEAVPYQHIGPVTRRHPEHISTDPLETTADVLWNIVPDDPNWCTVRDFVFEVNEKHNDDAPATEFRILEYYDQVGEFRYTLTDLQNDTIYIYRTCFKFAEVIGVWYCGKSIEFPTTILRVPEIQLTTVTTSEIGFFWGNNDNQDFVTGHTVYIEAIKPYHLTPAHCKSKWNMSSFVEQDLPATTESFNFEYAYPSFLYHIEVTTHFDGLGVNRTAMKDDVVTDEGVPGYLDIETSYDYVPLTPFNVSLKAKWEIPCDINGVVQNFTYTLKGVLKSESVLACDVKIGSGVLNVASDHEIYTDDEVAVDETIFEIEIPGVLPFFDYVLEVETRIPKYSSLTTMELDDVPQAYAPPS